jgi:hypothetical protein
MNQRGYLYLSLMVAVGILSFSLPAETAMFPLLIVWPVGLGYFIYYIFHKDLHHGIFKALLLSFAILALAFVPVVGWLILLGFVIYNLKRTLGSLKNLWPDLKLSLIFYGVFLCRTILEIEVDDLAPFAALATIYLLAAVIYCRKLQMLPYREGLLKLSLMWLALPFIVLLIISIVSALGNLFKTVTGTVTRTILTPQTVSAHMRGGVEISAYTRNISSTVTQITTSTAPNTAVIGASVVASGVTGEVAESAQKKSGHA